MLDNCFPSVIEMITENVLYDKLKPIKCGKYAVTEEIRRGQILFHSTVSLFLVCSVLLLSTGKSVAIVNMEQT